MEIENRKRSDDTTVVQPPAHKKPRQSYSWEGKSSKVCIPLYCYGRTIHDRECNICVVDLSSETHDFSPSLDPTFKIKYVPDAADGVREPGSVREGFCALGNRLYIFESCVYNEKKAVYYIDISNPLEFASQTLLITHLPKIGEMRSAKYNPTAVVVPNTCKILVFPNEVVRKGIPMTNIIGGFELFDTVDGSSRELPSIQLPAPIRGCHIEAYGFIDTHRLSIQILVGQIYVLDLDSLDKGWVPTANPSWLDHLAVGSCTNSTSFDVVEGRFCFRTCGGIRDLQVQVGVGKEGEEHDPYYLWVLSKVIPDINSPQCFLTLLNHDEQAGESCICRLAVETSERQRPKKSIRMQFDVAVLDLKRYKQELELPGNSTTDYTRSVKSLRYSLNLPGAEYKVFTNRTFFSF